MWVGVGVPYDQLTAPVEPVVEGHEVQPQARPCPLEDLVIGVRPAEIELLLAPRGLVVKADVAARDPILGRLHVVRDAHAPGY